MSVQLRKEKSPDSNLTTKNLQQLKQTEEAEYDIDDKAKTWLKSNL
jgi:hypothetical protein